MNRRMIGELLYSCVNVEAGLHRSEFGVLMVLYACGCENYMGSRGRRYLMVDLYPSLWCGCFCVIL